ncbi:MAG: response regulator transcription factor [Candidatus Omnitrophica bacterium]|nr:response regulator transcription factor [Candidatus Omnitrophota bacterium]
MGKRILAIDDNVDFLSILEDMLKFEGFEVKTLSEPEKAEDYISSFRPDLIVIDVFMPGRSGFNILEDFKEKGIYSEIPKIFLTCLDDDIEKMTAKACGVSKYLTKPFENEELVGLINELLGGKPAYK